MKITDTFCNFLGSVHGGAIATIVDIISSEALFYFSGQNYNHLAIAINVGFMKAIHSGDHLLALVKLSKKGKKLWFVSCNIFNEKEELCYEATAVASMGPHLSDSDVKMSPKL